MSKQQVRVRPLEARDEVRWRELFVGHLAFHKAELPESVLQLTWQRLLAGSPEALVGLVAVDNSDQPIGLAHMLFHASTWSATCCCYIEDLYVDPAVRGRGVGRALIADVYALADAREASRTYWAVAADNAQARAFYDRVAKLQDYLRYQR